MELALLMARKEEKGENGWMDTDLALRIAAELSHCLCLEM